MTVTPAGTRIRSAAAVLLSSLVAVGAVDQASRQLLRRSLAQAVGLSWVPSPLLVLGVVAVAGALLLWLWRGRGTDRLLATVLAISFVFGLYAQREFGARLASDGLRYFAFLRSIAFDHDVDLANDYRLLGLDDDQALMTPTATGHVQSPFSVGPAVAWLPSVIVAHAAVRALNAATGYTLAVDGTSYPYRQAVCIASLIYGLLGLWFCYRLATLVVDRTRSAVATATIGCASFMLWYFVREPSMSHAVSMCASAAFLYGWVATRERRSPARWALVGLLAGAAMTARWQNGVLLVLPAADWALVAWRARADGPAGAFRRTVLCGALFAGGALVGFLPQMLTWQAIYGAPFAVSPLSPKILWSHPAIAHMLWSSRNGLFATSPITYLATLGLLLVPRRDRVFGWSALAILCLSIYLNASVEDWWAGASYGPRRFDGVIPLFVVGLAAAIDWLTRFVARRPMAAVVTLLLAFVAWNLTFMSVLVPEFGLSTPRPLGAIAGRQAETLHRWIGHPFSYPANLWFGLRNGLSPARYDILAFEFLSEPERPYGKVEIGKDDEDYLLDGWYGGEADLDGTTWRWTSETSGVLVPLDHAAPLLLQARVIPFTYDAAPEATVAARVNGRPYGPIRVPAGGWQRIEIPVDAAAWRPGINRVEWLWLTAAAPSRVGGGPDNRVLGARVDFVRVQVAR